MKQTTFYLLWAIFWACSNPKTKMEHVIAKDTVGIEKNELIEHFYIPLYNLDLIGDFNGDGKIDSIIQKTISGLTRRSIDSIPADYEPRFFDSLRSDVILISPNLKFDTLHFGYNKGLYCLINIGDINSDGKDEIALSVMLNDFSSLNSCRIYTLCKNKFTELMAFKINEHSFDYEGNSQPRFNEIKGSLEKRKKQWMYIDYYKWFNASKPQDTLFQPLKLKKGC